MRHSITSCSAVTYNMARYFDAEVHTVPPEYLLGIGQILAEQRLYEAIRAILIHRHQELLDEMVMAHSYPDMVA